MLAAFGLDQCLIPGLVEIAMQPVATSRTKLTQHKPTAWFSSDQEYLRAPPTRDESAASDFSRKHPG